LKATTNGSNLEHNFLLSLEFSADSLECRIAAKDHV
jgi:hypothetical protein